MIIVDAQNNIHHVEDVTLKDIKQLPLPLRFVYNGTELLTVDSLDNFILFRRHIGAINFPLHIVFIVFGYTDKGDMFYYEPVSRLLFTQEHQVDQFVEEITQKEVLDGSCY